MCLFCYVNPCGGGTEGGGWLTLLDPWHESEQWHQMLSVFIVIFTARRVKYKQCRFHSRTYPRDEAVKVASFRKSQVFFSIFDELGGKV